MSGSDDLMFETVNKSNKHNHGVDDETLELKNVRCVMFKSMSEAVDRRFRMPWKVIVPKRHRLVQTTTDAMRAHAQRNTVLQCYSVPSHDPPPSSDVSSCSDPDTAAV